MPLFSIPSRSSWGIGEIADLPFASHHRGKEDAAGTVVGHFLGGGERHQVALLIFELRVGVGLFLLEQPLELDVLQRRVGGVARGQRLRYVTLPMMRNIISITVLFSLIVTFANYDIVRVLTNGGPSGATVGSGAVVASAATMHGVAWNVFAPALTRV